MPIYRGVDGVNREITGQFRGVEGVNRKIKEQYRVVDGVYRKVFAEEPIEEPISTYTLNLDKLIGSYELYDYDTYLFIRINGSHIDGATETITNRVICGWEIQNIQIGDEVTFSYEFRTSPTSGMYANLFYYDGAQYSSALAWNANKNASETITCAGNLVRLLQSCGTGVTFDKSTKITSILLNGNQIYPII
jgi:hypothetical protein